MGYKINTIIQVTQGDITQLKVDAIVNAANSTLLGGGGVDGAIHRAAGPGLLKECRSLGGCKTGAAKLTQGYDLPAKYVIHTVGPVWHGGKNHEPELLANCYLNSLKIALKHPIKAIAFPAISCGIYGYPIEQAARIAIQTIKKFVEENDSLKKVILCCFSEHDYQVYKKTLAML